jgi:hypothetical protein
VFISIHQPECYPWLGFFEKMSRVEKFVLLDNVQFKKRYFENRNRFRSADGWLYLTVPVKTSGRLEQKIMDVEINKEANWPKKHMKTIEMLYHNAPYWEENKPFFEDIFSRRWDKLVDFNIEAINYLAGKFGIATPRIRASELGVEGKGPQLVLDVCKAAGAKKHLSGRDGKDFLILEDFAAAGIEVEFQDFKHPVYNQRYKPFEPAMSAFDLLLNEGPKSLSIIKDAQAMRGDARNE